MQLRQRSLWSVACLTSIALDGRAAEPDPMRRRAPLGADVSRSADLSYTYGKYSCVRRKGTEEGHYFHIWQTDDSAAWKLVLDWQQALPEKKP